jgi:sugar (pentulose or hexulose) kinase
MNIIAIDCGASFIKSAFFKDDELVEKKLSQTPYSASGRKIEKTVALVLESIRYFCNKYSLKSVSLGFSNEMHGFLLVDSNGKLVTDYISWQDSSSLMVSSNGKTFFENFQDSFSSLLPETGMNARAGLPSTCLYTMKMLGKLPLDRDLFFYSLGDYVASSIAKNNIPCHQSNAAGSGLFSLKQSSWHKVLLDSLGLPNIHFPLVTAVPNPFLVRLDGVDFSIYPAIGDQQAALFGAGLSDENDVSINYGTGGQVSMISKSLSFSPEYQVRPYFEGFYLKTVPHIPAGRAMNVFVNFISDTATSLGLTFSKDQIWKRAIDLASQNPSLLEVDMGVFPNAITKDDKGAISNINEQNLTFANLFGSLFQETSKNTEIAYRRLRNEKSIQKLIFSGSVCRRNPLLRSLIESRLKPQKPSIVAVDETFYGIKKFIGIK